MYQPKSPTIDATPTKNVAADNQGTGQAKEKHIKNETACVRRIENFPPTDRPRDRAYGCNHYRRRGNSQQGEEVAAIKPDRAVN